MSKFKSFAKQGSFRDYQIQAPDETGKIKEETARTIRGKERAQASLERNNALYLQAQKLAQGVEQNQREDNYKRETENRQAFKDALTRDYEIGIQNDKIRAKQSAETYKQLSAFSESAFKLYGKLNEIDLKRNQELNAKLAYAAGADFKTVVAIQSLGDNLTKSEFAQTEFMRRKLEEGGNVDALFALYERRASRAFINNIAVAQNTAYGYETAAQLEDQRFIEEYAAENGRQPSVEERRVNLNAFESEYAAGFTAEDGRALNGNMLNTYVYPIMKRSQTKFLSNFEKEGQAEKENKVKVAFNTAMNTAWNSGGAKAVVERLREDASAGKFELFAEWAKNKSLDFSPTGLSSENMDELYRIEYEGVNGMPTTYGTSRGTLGDGATFLQARNVRERAEKQLYRDAEADLKRTAQSAGVEYYNEAIANGSVTAEEVAESKRRDAEFGIPGFESEGTKQLAAQQDSVRFEGFFRETFTKKVNNGTLTFQDLNQAGVSHALRQEFLPALEKQNLITQSQEYKDGVEAIKGVITTGHPLVVQGRGAGNRDHWTTNQLVNQEIQEFRKQAILLGDPSQLSTLSSGRMQIIKAKQETPGYIDKNGHYTSLIAETKEQAEDYRAMQLEDGKFLAGRAKANFSDPSVAVNVYGQNNFYEDYYPMQRGQITSRLRRRAAQMGMSPLAAINFLAGGVGQPAIAQDAAVQALMEKVAPLNRLINIYKTDARLNRAMVTMNGAVKPLRNPKPMEPGFRGLAGLVSSGEGGATSMFPSESYPEMLDMDIRTELVAFQKEKLRDGRASAAVGMFQFLKPEVAADLAGLPPGAKFTVENQYKMFVATTLNQPGREGLSSYLKGESDDIETALDDLAKEWASIAGRDGRSYYKDGTNKASISRDQARSALISAREEYIKSNQ